MTMKKVTDRVREMQAKKEAEGAGQGRGVSGGEAADALCSLAFQVFNSTVGDRAYAPDSYHHAIKSVLIGVGGGWLGGRCAGRE